MRPIGPIRDRAQAAALLAVLALTVGSCGPRRLAVVAPAPNADAEARTLAERTRLERPVRIIFSWQLNEQGGRARGRGVARIEPPYKARLDLFLENLEPVVTAALVDDELRLPVGSREEFLPPPELMWGSLGIFRPQEGTTLLGGDSLEGGLLRLRYAYGEGRELHFQSDDGALDRLDLLRGGRVSEWVRMEMTEGDRYPSEATYRNLEDFRELRITRESLDYVSPFPPDIWDPRGR